MKTWVALALSLTLSLPLMAQRKLTINAETPEGQMLQQIGQEEDEAKKLAMLEEFAAQYPKHEAAAWVYSQIVQKAHAANQHDKAIAAGEALYALDPDDVEFSVIALKSAVAKQDPDLVMKWTPRVSAAATKAVNAPKPADEEEAEEWKQRSDFSRQVLNYTEYAYYVTGLQTQDHRKKLELFAMLEKEYPQSQYIAQTYGQQFLALNQLGEKVKAVAIAEKVLETDQSNEDMLLAAASYYYEGRKEHGKVLDYAGKLATLMSSKTKPDGVSDADWARRKNLILGLAHWMTGVTYSGQSKWAMADKALREALPLLEGNNALKAETLFHLGLANYRLGAAEKGDTKRILDALRFNEQCAAIASPFRAQAQANIKAIRSQYAIR